MPRNDRTNVLDMDAQELSYFQHLAEQAVFQSRSSQQLFPYSYRGEEDLGVHWSFIFSSSNVAEEHDLVQHANYLAAAELLSEKFPEDVRDVTFSGPLRGVQSYHVLVRMLGDDEVVTPAGIAALQLNEQIRDYPLLDEELFSELELKQFSQAIEDELRYGFGLDIDGDDVSRVLEYLSEEYHIYNADSLAFYSTSGPLSDAVIELDLRETTAV